MKRSEAGGESTAIALMNGKSPPAHAAFVSVVPLLARVYNTALVYGKMRKKSVLKTLTSSETKLEMPAT